MKICPNCRHCYEDSESSCSLDNTALISSRPGSRLITEKYQLERLLGRGGVGAVYQSTHIELRRPVAIKLLLPDFIADDQALRRFRQEARAAASINHPNVAEVFDYGTLPGGEAYIVMELVRGETLREFIRATPEVSFDRAATIIAQVADGIEAAHRAGIIHRDLKPSNIILTQDHQQRLQAKVVDFGIAKLKEQTYTSDHQLTGSGWFVGTPRYMSPEQSAGEELDARSDIYSLAVVLYELVAGKPPFDAPTATAIAIKHMQEAPLPLDKFRAGVPPALTELIMESLDKDPARRPQSAAEFAERLRDYGSTPTQKFINPAVTAPITDALPISAATTPDSRDLNAPIATDTAVSAAPAASAPFVAVQRDAAVGKERNIVESDESARYRTLPDTQVARRSRPVTWLAAALALTLAVTGGWLIMKRTPFGAHNSAPTTTTENVRNRDNSSPTVAVPVFQSPGNSSDKSSQPVKPASSTTPVTAPRNTVKQTAETGDNNSRDTNNRRVVLPDNTSPNYKPVAERTRPVNERTRSENEPTRPENEPTRPETMRPEDERQQLRSAFNSWLSTTNSRDIKRQGSLYMPKLGTFYQARNLPRTAVLAEKSRVFGRATVIDVRASEPEINMSGDGQSAVMRFRKDYVISGGNVNRRGAVLQELHWQKTRSGWKIAGERDVKVLE